MIFAAKKARTVSVRALNDCIMCVSLRGSARFFPCAAPHPAGASGARRVLFGTAGGRTEAARRSPERESYIERRKALAAVVFPHGGGNGAIQKNALRRGERLQPAAARGRPGTAAAKDTEFPEEKLRKAECRRKTGVGIRRDIAYFDKILCKSLQPLVETIGKAANKY